MIPPLLGHRRPGAHRPGASLHVALAVAAAVALVGAALAAFTPPPAPTRWVTDSAGFLSPAARQELDSRLESYQGQTGHQVLVWITSSAGEMSPEDFANQAFQAWRVGRKGIDDGLVLFVFAEDRKLRFEVGYGLEAALTDATAGRILSDVAVPRLRADDRDGAIRSAVEAAIAVIGGGAVAAEPSASQAEPVPAGHPQLTTGQKILVGIGVVLFLALLVTHPQLAIWLLINILSSGGRSSGGGGGGGFSGGGGSSGGGGATGSW